MVVVCFSKNISYGLVRTVRSYRGQIEPVRMSRKRKQDFLLKQKSAQLNEMTEEPATQRLY